MREQLNVETGGGVLNMGGGNGGGLYFEVGGKIIVKTMVSEPFWAI